MSPSDEQKTIVKGVWSDSYTFYLKYHGRAMDPVLWEEAVREFGAIIKKYNGAITCVRVMLAALSRLEEEAR